MSSLNWLVESFRFSFINTESDDAHKDFVWSSLTSDKPDTITSKPNLGLHTETGPWMNANLTVSKQYGRTDITISAVETESPMQALGDISDMVGLAHEVMPALTSLKSHRLAFGAVLLLPVPTAVEGYEYLKKFLPFVEISEDMSDLFLQINRKKIGVDGFVVNELSKWGALKFRRLILESVDVGQPLNDLFAVRLELDINNPEFEAEVYGDIIYKNLEDFLSRAKRISIEGAS